MEGVAYAIANCFEAIQDIARKRQEAVTSIRIGESGGGRLALWRQIVTDVLGCSLEVVHVEEPGCLGVALLAGVGVGEYEDVQDAIRRTVDVVSRTSPDSGRSGLYQERRSAFNATYRAIETILYEQTKTEEAG